MHHAYSVYNQEKKCAYKELLSLNLYTLTFYDVFCIFLSRAELKYGNYSFEKICKSNFLYRSNSLSTTVFKGSNPGTVERCIKSKSKIWPKKISSRIYFIKKSATLLTVHGGSHFQQ